MTQIINKNPIISAQGKADERMRRSGTRAMFKTLLIAEAILIALIFATYAARKTIATVQMAPHCQAIAPCHWTPSTHTQIAEN